MGSEAHSSLSPLLTSVYKLPLDFRKKKIVSLFIEKYNKSLGLWGLLLGNVEDYYWEMSKMMEGYRG